MANNSIEMDSDVLRSTAKQVDGASSEIGKQLQKFQTTIEGLSKSWSSDVKERFFQSYQNDLKALQEMITQYGEVAQGLMEIADDMDRAEEESESLINKSARG